MRCILHIGTEKTATTLLQEWLYHNFDQLSAQGVALTKSAGFQNNRMLVSYFQSVPDEYLKGRDVHNKQEKQAYFANFEKKFAAEISKLEKNHTACLFTSEHFHSRLVSIDEIQRLKDFLARFFDDITVLCYFREQSKVRTSLYSTGLKVNFDGSIHEFQDQATPQSHFFNYLTFFRKWEKAFGMGALRPRLFHQDQMVEGDIRKDLLATALPEVNPDILNYDHHSSNESLSADEAVLYRTVNTKRKRFVGKYVDPTPALFKSAVRGLPMLDLKTGILDSRQVDMYEAFHESNVAFFARYFGREENLFPRPRDAGESAGGEKRFDINDMAELLSSILSVNRLVGIEGSEINFLIGLTNRLHAAGQISNQEAIGLLKIANRGRPEGPAILAKIDQLRNAK